MASDPDVLNAIHPLYLSISDPEDDSRSEVLSFDGYDMFGLVDNPDEIVFAHTDHHEKAPASSFRPGLDSGGDAQDSSDDVISLDWDSDDEAETSSNDVIHMYPNSNHSDTSSVGLVCHLTC